jgi:hypothetical protein
MAKCWKMQAETIRFYRMIGEKKGVQMEKQLREELDKIGMDYGNVSFEYYL